MQAPLKHTSTPKTRVTRIKTTATGGSVFEDIDVPLNVKNWIGSLSAGFGVHELVFRETDGAYDLGWHTAPCRQLIIMTNGGVEITTTDGVERQFADGDVILVEDTTGQGHRSCAVGGKSRKSILVKLRDDAPAFMPQEPQPADKATAAAALTNGAAAVDNQSSRAESANGPVSDSIQAALDSAADSYRQRHPKSWEQHLRATKAMPGGNTRTSLFSSPFPLTLAKGDGSKVWDLDGHEYVDGVGEFTAGVAGHSHPVIQRAIREALANGINLGGHTPAELAFAEELKKRFPSMELLRFTNSGTEANLMAIATARAYTQRPKVMGFRHGYHGSMLMFAEPSSPVNAAFELLIAEYNDCAAAEALIAANRDSLACVILEGMLGSGGCIPASADFVQTLRRATLQVGALLILDEVMTSRLATGGLQAALGIRPDLTTLGKYLGGGLSFGAFGGRADVMAQFDPRRQTGFLRHAGTFNNDALTMAAGYAGITQVYTAEALEALNGRGNRLRADLNALSEQHGSKLQWTGRGSMLMPHFVRGQLASFTQASQADARLKQLLFLELNRHGIWTNSSCMMNLSLPFGDAECTALVGAVDMFLEEHGSLTKDVVS